VKRPTKEADVVRWGVFKLRSKAARLGTVEATDQPEALKRAYEKFTIAEGERWRISVQRE
jgi:hypothetical protein